MKKSVLIALLLLGAVGTACAFMIAGTYVVLHIPLPFSVMLSCVTMTAAVMLMGLRAKRTNRVADAEHSFSYPSPSGPGTARTTAESLLVLLPMASAQEEHREAKTEASPAPRRPVPIRVDAITLFDLPLAAQDREAA